MADNMNKGFNSQKPENPQGDKTPNKPKIGNYWIYIVITIALIAFTFIDFGPKAKSINRNKFETEMLRNNDVAKIVIVNRERVDIYIKPDKLAEERFADLGKGISSPSKTGPHYFFMIGDVETFERQLAEAQKDFAPENIITAEYKTERNYLGEVLGWLLPIAILVGLWIFLFRRMNGGGAGGSQIFNIGKSKAQLFDKEKHVNTNFNDVAGLEEAKVEIMEIVNFLKNPKRYTELGGKIPKGALLVGPPGTGKTLLAKAVAGEANVPFFSMSGSDFVEMFVGVGASRVRDLFKQAKQKSPCIIFIDEIDAIGRARGRNPNFGSNDERENTLNQLLTEMDGFASNSGVIILAATNRADVLDKALLRAGRFDRQIHVELPDIKEREDIFKVHIRPLKLSKDVKLDFLAKQTPGFSGADIANVCNEAALIAARKNKKKVEKQDFLDAVDRIIGGLEKKNKIISMNEKKTIAYHEAGHASVGWLLEHAHPLLKVTIIPRGKALGAAWYLPEERQITTTEQMYDEICATLGGRAAEEVFFGKISTGALNDLERVTKQAFAMVAYFGMNEKVGNLSYYDSTGQSEYSFSKPFSEKTAETIDDEVKRIVAEQYERAKAILIEHKKGIEALADKLLEKEVIFGDDLEAIFGKKKGKENEAVEEDSRKADSEEAANTENEPVDTVIKETEELTDTEDKENTDV
ncbi:MAG TPA: ATP-dependent zinc metalloprotease FtsH [Bacteroidales bacterium]|nr:ATP-dependent zinc metalloprotease FtsH [Bacteroidales bacterium]